MVLVMRHLTPIRFVMRHHARLWLIFNRDCLRPRSGTGNRVAVGNYDWSPWRSPHGGSDMAAWRHRERIAA